MSDDLYLLITAVNKQDMQMLRIAYHCKRNTQFSENYMYWNEKDVAKTYLEIFNSNTDIAVLDVIEIDDIKFLKKEENKDGKE